MDKKEQHSLQLVLLIGADYISYHKSRTSPISTAAHLGFFQGRRVLPAMKANIMVRLFRIFAVMRTYSLPCLLLSMHPNHYKRYINYWSPFVVLPQTYKEPPIHSTIIGAFVIRHSFAWLAGRMHSWESAAVSFL